MIEPVSPLVFLNSVKKLFEKSLKFYNLPIYNFIIIPDPIPNLNSNPFP
jgi:hypothetical protein